MQRLNPEALVSALYAPPALPGRRSARQSEGNQTIGHKIHEKRKKLRPHPDPSTNLFVFVFLVFFVAIPAPVRP